MSISTAFVMVTCNHCTFRRVKVMLTALPPRGTWDERLVGKRLEGMGWNVGEDGDAICPECVVAIVEAAEE